MNLRKIVTNLTVLLLTVSFITPPPVLASTEHFEGVYQEETYYSYEQESQNDYLYYYNYEYNLFDYDFYPNLYEIEIDPFNASEGILSPGGNLVEVRNRRAPSDRVGVTVAGDLYVDGERVHFEFRYPHNFPNLRNRIHITPIQNWFTGTRNINFEVAVSGSWTNAHLQVGRLEVRERLANGTFRRHDYDNVVRVSVANINVYSPRSNQTLGTNIPLPMLQGWFAFYYCIERDRFVWNSSGWQSITSRPYGTFTRTGTLS